MLDTHRTHCFTGQLERLYQRARDHIKNKDGEFICGTASLWEVVIKPEWGRDVFTVYTPLLWRGLDKDYSELLSGAEYVVHLHAILGTIELKEMT